MLHETTHPSLLERVRSLGDQAAWREFDDAYRELILRYAARRGLQASDAEDLRQQVMLRLAERLPSFTYRPEVGRFRDYLGTIVRNLIHRHFARQERRQALLEEVDAEPPPAADDEAWEQEWMHHHYRLAMAQVRRQFQPASLEVFDGLLAGRSVEALCREHGTSPEAVYKIKQRVRDRLRELIARQIRDEEFAERRAEA